LQQQLQQPDYFTAAHLHCLLLLPLLRLPRPIASRLHPGHLAVRRLRPLLGHYSISSSFVSRFYLRPPRLPLSTTAAPHHHHHHYYTTDCFTILQAGSRRWTFSAAGRGAVATPRSHLARMAMIEMIAVPFIVRRPVATCCRLRPVHRRRIRDYYLAVCEASQLRACGHSRDHFIFFYLNGFVRLRMAVWVSGELDYFVRFAIVSVTIGSHADY